LIVEVDEDQHRRPVNFWDKPHIVTVSGVSRGRQRAVYDARKRAAARAHGFTVVEVPWERRPPPGRRNREADRRRLARLLSQAGVSL
jgi:very-short-patch-repair endonuclease